MEPNSRDEVEVDWFQNTDFEKTDRNRNSFVFEINEFDLSLLTRIAITQLNIGLFECDQIKMDISIFEIRRLSR